MDWIIILLIVVILDFLIGDPPSWPHPIRFIGFIIKKYEILIRRIKTIPLKLGGFLLTIFSIVTIVLVVTIILEVSKKVHPIMYKTLSGYLLFTTIAAKCLHLEAKKVYKSLKEGDISKSRILLSYLVGRDTNNLSEDEITRGVIETVAENTIDGVLAPILYIGIGIILNIPVQMAFIYKTINTLDSMVGYIQEPYKDIGYASAKLDDIANYVPARIGSALMLLSGIVLGYDARNGYKILKRDKKNHKSPNCGYPEAVVAGLLKIQLGGTNTYFSQKVYKPTIGDNIKTLNTQNIIDAIRIMYGAQIFSLLLYIIIYYIYIINS